jgi:hypothetical protein
MFPDPYNAGAFLDGPQTWNAYSYVANNPLNAIDPNGLDCVYLNEAGDKVQEVKSGDFRSETDNGYYVNGTSGRSDEDEVYTGNLLRVYTKSHFLDHLSRDTGGHFEPVNVVFSRVEKIESNLTSSP